MTFITIIEELTKSRAIRQGNLDIALHEILEKSADGLMVDRVNCWSVDPEFTTLKCIGSFEKKNKKFSKGQVLLKKDYPEYFNYIHLSEKVISHDAVSSPYNKELLDSYILPMNIGSMMDIPIRVEGEMIGMVCFEHLGDIRYWTLSEQSFALSIAQLMSLTFETYQKNLYRKKLENALHEKEILLSEINHRVKNNMVIIGSLINLQKYKAKDEYHVSLFDEVKERIFSMAFIHEQLYQSKNYSEIDFGLYLNNLLNHLSGSMLNGKKVSIRKNIEHIPMDIKRAIPCGLITNEIVTNAFKYAFKDRSEGVLDVEFLKSGKHFKLVFRDDGPGFSEETRKNSVGLGLVEDLVQQMDGTLSIHSENGACVEMSFPL